MSTELVMFHIHCYHTNSVILSNNGVWSLLVTRVHRPARLLPGETWFHWVNLLGRGLNNPTGLELTSNTIDCNTITTCTIELVMTQWTWNTLTTGVPRLGQRFLLIPLTVLTLTLASPSCDLKVPNIGNQARNFAGDGTWLVGAPSNMAYTNNAIKVYFYISAA